MVSAWGVSGVTNTSRPLQLLFLNEVMIWWLLTISSKLASSSLSVFSWSRFWFGVKLKLGVMPGSPLLNCAVCFKFFSRTLFRFLWTGFRLLNNFFWVVFWRKIYLVCARDLAAWEDFVYRNHKFAQIASFLLRRERLIPRQSRFYFHGLFGPKVHTFQDHIFSLFQYFGWALFQALQHFWIVQFVLGIDIGLSHLHRVQ